MRDARGHYWIGSRCQYCGVMDSSSEARYSCSGERHSSVIDDWTPHDSTPTFTMPDFSASDTSSSFDSTPSVDTFSSDAFSGGDSGGGGGGSDF